MDQAGNNNNVNSQKPKKLTLKGLIVILFFTFTVGAILFCYFIFKKDYEDMAENSATYSDNAMISATDGIVSYVKDEDGNYVTDENGNYIPLTAGDVLEHINSISTYLEDDSEFTKEEKLEYLLNAGLVTKFPYIEELAEDKVNGIVKFYRYSETEQAEDPEQEKYLLKFVDEETFEQAMEAYETSGSNEVFKYFTIDEEQQLVIACMSETQKEVTTNDPEVTVDVINKTSADTYTGNNGKYNAGQKTITKQTKDYQSIIQQYTMPFNLLAAFLVQTGDYDFVKELADMAYESEIHIGIYENVSITTRSDTYTYAKRIEYTPNTVLEFSKLSTTNPVVKEDDVNRKIIRSCIANMPENLESPTLQVTHEMTTMGGEPGGEVYPAELYTKYVQSYSGSQISSLSDEGKTFETKYWTRTESRTSLTIGTILADTWVAKWGATYIAEPNEPTPGPTSSPPPDSERTVIQDGTSLFTGSAETEVLAKLKEHSENLKNNAVNSIIATTHVSVATPKMTAEMIRNQGYTCNTCKEELDNAFPGLPGDEDSNPWRDSSKLSNNELVARVKTQENLAHTRQHINSKLQNQSDQKLEKAQADFEKELKDEIGYIQYPTVAKSYVSINVEPYYEKTSVTHKQQTPERTEDGEKFKALFNNSEFHESKRAILDRIQWFWEYIREYDDTAKLENVLRYLLNIATDSNQFGNFTEEEIENLFKVFEPKELMKPATISGLQLLRQYICAWENQPLLNYINGEAGYSDYVAGYITADNKYYKVRDDGKGHPTVGFGIDLFNGSYYDEELCEWRMFWEVLVEDYGDTYGYTKENLQNITGEIEIPVEIIDDLKEKRIMHDYNYVIKLADTYGLDLTNYQIYALTSRCFNSWIEEEEFKEFVDVYSNYYNFETDDKYGEPYTNEDFEHRLYTEHMDEPITSDGDVEEGLIERRKSEWILFLTGYMDRLDRFVSENSIIDCAEMIHAYMEENEYTYCVYFYNNNSEEECANRSLCGLNVTFEESKTGYHHSCCATYVSWVLQEAGYLTRAEHTDGAGTLRDKLLEKKWQEVNSIDEAEPGDILYYDGHIEIYAGDYTVYNAGSGNAIRDPAPKKKENVVNAKMILRAP